MTLYLALHRFNVSGFAGPDGIVQRRDKAQPFGSLSAAAAWLHRHPDFLNWRQQVVLAEVPRVEVP